MLANAQQDMEAGLAKMQLNKKIAATKASIILRSFGIHLRISLFRIMKTNVLH